MYKALRHANLVTAPTLPQEEKKAHHVKKMKKRIIITPEEEQVPFDDISRLKVEGNTYYRNGHFEEAVRAYTVALALLPNNFDERAILHANRAAAFLKLRAYERVIEETTHCLASEPKHAKSLFRRAFANEMLQNYQLAIVDYETAYRFNPGSQDIQEALERVRVSMKGFQGS
jgi:tetratricopeptide (TPR) repeat protein